MLLSRLRLSPRRRRPALRAVLTALVCWINLALNLGTGLAGDILRGAGNGPQSRGAAAAEGNAPAAAVQAGVSGTDTLSRTTMALQAVTNMQAAARAAAHGANNAGADPNHPGHMLPNVPNGLVVGGLQVAPGVPVNLASPAPGENPALWQGANLPTQTTSSGQTQVTITQTAQQAILNWQTFNIGSATRLTFDQTAAGANASEWIAFNKVNDPSGVPSQILGSLDAIGQVYVINANGIIFGGNSQINLHTLVASSLPINDNLIARGLLNNPDDQFLFSALPISAGSNGPTPAFSPPASNIPGGNYGDVTVQSGAQITSPSNADNVGGRVALIGANVTNDGAITTPDGQTILAAGLQVGLAAHASTDPTLRGLDVYVGQVGTYAGTATNDGLIEAPRADVTLAGKNVDQFGFVDSSTSVSLNGRIDLLADYNAIPDTNANQNLPSFLFTSTGVVTLGSDSVTQIVPEYSSTERIVGSQLALNSTVFIQGLAIHDESNSILFAPGAAVSAASTAIDGQTLSAGVTLNAGVWTLTNTNSSKQLLDNFVLSSGQIYLDSDALIDVSGSQDVSASVTENIVAAQLLGPELANSPLQRNGPLRGQTVFIDITQHGTFDGQNWVGSPIGDLSGYVNLVQHTVGELTANGGTVNLNAGNSVVMQAGSNINVSGGTINYQGGLVQTSDVVDTSGHVYDISQATPDRVYAGIVNGFADVHVKWGIVNTFQNALQTGGRFEAGYVQGGNGGSLVISAPSMALDGTLAGATVAGTQQRSSPPTPAALSLTFQDQSLAGLPGLAFPPISPTPPSVTFSTTSDLPAAADFALDSSGNPLPLSTARQQNVVLSPGLLGANSFGSLTVTDSDGNIAVPANVVLNAGPQGSITFSGANIDIAGSLIAPGGSLSFIVYDFSPYTFLAVRALNEAAPPPDPTRGQFTLEGTGSLTTAGLIVDDRTTAGTNNTSPLVTQGGKISVTGYTVDLASGSKVNVSGGVVVSGTGTETFGNAGSISILAGQDPNVAAIFDGSLTLAGTLSGYSGAIGGSLTLQDTLVQVGGATADPHALLISPDFFNQGGFVNYSLRGLGETTGQMDQYVPAIVISADTVLAPTAESWLASVNSSGPIVLTPTLLPQGVRTPVSLSFNSPGVFDNLGSILLTRGDTVMGSGSSIVTDPGANAAVTMTGDTVTVLGDVRVPGGTITISGGSNSTRFLANQSEALPTVDIGPDSYLSTAGATVLTPNGLGLRTGTVLGGGNIKISGNIVAEAGSTLDVSGATDVLDLAPGYSGLAQTNSLVASQFVPTRIDTNAGTITLSGGQELFSDATLIGTAGGPSATGGNLVVSSSRFYGGGVVPLPTDVTMIVTQDGSTLPGSFNSGGQSVIGHPVLDSSGNALPQLGYFAADAFNNSGLASLTLQGAVQFNGSVSLTAARSIAIGSGGVIYGNSTVDLNAPYVQLGITFQPPLQPQQIADPFLVNGSPFVFQPTFGSGTLNVSSTLIDIGNLSLQGIGGVNLVANNGDVRGNGTFDVAGNVSITAGQIYPPTETVFTIAAYDYKVGVNSLSGSITLNGSGTRPLPLSAGGQLNLYSSVINDGGVLRAPLGTIDIGWNGTGTAPVDPIAGTHVPTAQQVTLQSGSVASVSAIDPVTGQPAVIPYGINSDGTAWIDPSATDITAGGVPQKAVNVSGLSVIDQTGAAIDVRGGGDLYAYQFVPGTGGTNDILNTSSSFAIIPGYGAGYAPYAAYNYSGGTSSPFGSAQTNNLDIGYTNSDLQVGGQIYLSGSSGLPAGTYTLLPARYALLPGAFLVTAQTGTPSAALLQPDGSSIVSGYQFNGFDAPQSQPILASFEIAPESVVRQRAQYNDYSANTFLKQGAISSNQAVPRLPIDAGQLVFAATTSLSIQGDVLSTTPSGGLGSLVDISSSGNILIADSGVIGAPGELVLDAASLTAFGADSLLIGGFRQTTASGTVVHVTSNNITLDNSGSPLSGPDVILVASDSISLAANADLEASGTLANAGTLVVNGNGALVRISSDPTAQISRLGADPSQPASLSIGAGAKMTGASLVLDSSSATSLDPTARITATAVYIDSGQISLQLQNVGNPSGLVLSSQALLNLQTGVKQLSLLSYSTIDVYGSGSIGALDSTGQASLGTLALHTAEIRGFDLGGGNVTLNAQTISIDNSANGSGPGPDPTLNGTLDGSLVLNANQIQLGANETTVDQIANVVLNATNGVLFTSNGGLTVAGLLQVNTPVMAGATGATSIITGLNGVDVESIQGGTAKVIGGLGASLTILGAFVTENSELTLPSGSITLNATGSTQNSEDVTVGGTLDVSGTAQTFFDATKYTNGGNITLTSDNGSVSLNAAGSLDVSAQSGGGNAGTISVGAPTGSLAMNGTIKGSGGANGLNGSFTLDIGSLPSLSSLDAQLNAASLTQSRSIRVRTGDVMVDGLATSHTFNLSVDQGSIDVTGTIDASGSTGGTINLNASGSVILAGGSSLSVAAQSFNDAGKGGAVSLEAGSEVNGVINPNALIDIQSGSSIDLSVAAENASSASLGDFTGTLHLRAPQLADGSDLQMNPINGSIVGASSIVIEGYKLFDVTGDGSIDGQEANVFANGQLFGNDGAAISSRVLANNSGLASITVVVPGAEIINRTGDLTLGSESSDYTSDWDLSTYRFGPNGVPGVLTLRAAGNLVFYNALSDGFDPSQSQAEDPSLALWFAPLMAQNTNLPVNVQSWSFNLTAGADFSAADVQRVQPLSALNGSGSILLGKNAGNNVSNPFGANGVPDTAIENHFQVIRTGTGDINISAGQNVELLNEFASIYTTGTQILDATMGGTFDVPTPDLFGMSTGSLGVVLQPDYYPVQYSFAGGNILVSAQNDIMRATLDSNGNLVADSSREMPVNWLYRRGAVDPTTGDFATSHYGEIASTTWWIDFSNFFEGVGALGGGNVVLTAGHNVSNVDAVAPTNARMPGKDAMGNAIAPNASSLVELGGGDVTVSAGNNIDAGVYYVERGQGSLTAGNQIVTNSTRSPSLTDLSIPATVDPSQTWLPTTLFLGQGSFDVEARNDVLLGPVANPFLLPQSFNNWYWYKTYFSTYGANDSVNVSSLMGSVTLRESATLPTTAARAPVAVPLLQAWFSNELMLNTSQFSASFFQPWLRLDESNVTQFQTVFGLMPPTLQVTSFSGNLNIVGSITLSPAAQGNLSLDVNGSINGLQPTGVFSLNGTQTTAWTAATIDVSDANPNAIPGITSPLAYQLFVGTTSANSSDQTGVSGFLNQITTLFQESGSTTGIFGVLQTKQELHATGILHLSDPQPVELYSLTGDISGITLFSPTVTKVVAGQDVTDIALYIQNVNASDISVVSAGRDLIAFDTNSPLRSDAQATGNVAAPGSGPLAGDIQIGGPGTLEVLAGRNLNLGIGPENADGTGVGITSIGNARNPTLPFDGASIIASAGVGGEDGLANNLNFSNFISQFLDPTNAASFSSRYLPDLGGLLGLSNATNDQVWTAFEQLSKQDQGRFALDIFYLVLRDAGRDHNDPSSPTFGKYTNGDAAIAALFPTTATYSGDISLTSREIKTANGGDISLFAPGGALNVGVSVTGTQASDQGILTEDGGNINIFTNGSVNVGTSRIFTLRGGNEIIWSTTGDIAAGSSSKTVLAAPPTRVLVDPQSGDIQTDLAGLATGGGIGVLESVTGVPPADVDLIAPAGTVDAGDAGIRVSGNINIAALIVLNVGNIQVGGSSSGIPTVAAPNISGLSNASNTTAASSEAAAQLVSQNTAPVAQEDTPSDISVEVIGYGGGDGQDEEERRRKKREQEEHPRTSAARGAVEVSAVQSRKVRAHSL